MAEQRLGSGLGLELSLGLGTTASRKPLPASPDTVPASRPSSDINRNCLSDLFRCQIEGNEGAMVWRGLEFSLCNGEELRVASPNSAVSSSSGKRSERGNENDDGEWCRGSDDDAAGGSDLSRKKLRLSKYQSLLLEDAFKDHSTLNPMQKLGLAKQLNLRPRQVEVWFQNRRARTKLKQTEVDCEYLRKCCERLSEENRRLQKEAQDLRALKMSSQVYMHMNPPTTLTMCPSCEKIAASSTSAPSTAAEGPAKSTECLPRAASALVPWPALHVPL